MEQLRELAKGAYNRAFELVVEGTDSDIAEGLELAAGSLHLWRIIGNETNWSIGAWLYSRALLKAGLQQLAIAKAEESYQYAKVAGTDWLIASALEGLARAQQGTTEFDGAKMLAELAIANIADPEDRALIESQFADLC